MPKCKIIAEPVRHKGRDYSNGEILEAPAEVITSLISVGVAVSVEDIPTALTPPIEIPPPPTTSNRRRKPVEAEEEVVE